MAKKRRAKPRASAQAHEEFRHAVFLLADAMDETLRHATQMVFVVGSVDSRLNDEASAMALVAMEAKDKLDFVGDMLTKLFRLTARAHRAA